MRSFPFILFLGITKLQRAIATIFKAEAAGIKGRLRRVALATWGVIFLESPCHAGWRHDEVVRVETIAACFKDTGAIL
jgi:hypothetical protein